ncbi:MAG: ATP-binding domain-containing protein [Desulfobacterales bacterium]
MFNGDIGRVTDILPERRELTVDIDGRRILCQAGEQDELTLAYAISIHKSQGSEFLAVVIPVLTQHYVLLQRNLIYTAITRGKRLVVLVGNRKALALAVGSDVGWAFFPSLWMAAGGRSEGRRGRVDDASLFAAVITVSSLG